MPLRPLDVLWWALKGLREARTRSILTILGVAVGAALIVAVTSVSTSYGESIKYFLFKGWNPNAVYVIAMSRLTLADIQMLSELPHVRDVVPIKMETCMVQAMGGFRAVQLVVFPTDSMLRLAYPQLRVEPANARLGLGRVLVGEEVAYPSGKPPFSPPGSRVVLQCGGLRVIATVAGVVRRISVTFTWPELASSIVATEETTPLPGGWYAGAIVLVDDPGNVERVYDTIAKLFTGRAFVLAPLTMIESFERAMAEMNMLAASIAAVSMLVAGIGITATMMMSVYQRAKEVAILKTFGYTRWQVMTLFLAEAMMIGLLGSLIGAAAGVGLGYVFYEFMGGMSIMTPERTPYMVDLFWLPTTVVLSLIVSLLAGVYPASRAASLEPVKVLRGV